MPSFEFLEFEFLEFEYLEFEYLEFEYLEFEFFGFEFFGFEYLEAVFINRKCDVFVLAGVRSVPDQSMTIRASGCPFRITRASTMSACSTVSRGPYRTRYNSRPRTTTDVIRQR